MEPLCTIDCAYYQISSEDQAKPGFSDLEIKPGAA
jgi:hypothetical protein